MTPVRKYIRMAKLQLKCCSCFRTCAVLCGGSATVKAHIFASRLHQNCTVTHWSSWFFQEVTRGYALNVIDNSTFAFITSYCISGVVPTSMALIIVLCWNRDDRQKFRVWNSLVCFVSVSVIPLFAVFSTVTIASWFSPPLQLCPLTLNVEPWTDFAKIPLCATYVRPDL